MASPYVFNLPDLQPGFDAGADQQQEDYYSILRKMQSVPAIQIPEDQGMPWDPKGMLIGGGVAALFGGAEGANAYLQGTLQGTNIRYQQQQAAQQRKLQQDKLNQERELGMLKTEADIANDKANRAFQRASQYRGDVKEEKRLADALRRDMAKGRVDILEKIVGARPSTEGWFPIMFKIAEDSGLAFSPEEKEGIVQLYRNGKAEEAQFTFAKSLLTGLRSPSVQARASSARLLKPILQQNPGFLGMMGQDPNIIAQEIAEGLKSAEELTINELLNQKKTIEIQSNIDAKDFKLKMDKEFGPQKFRLQIQEMEGKIAEQKSRNAKRDAEIKKINEAIEMAKKGLGPGGKPLTATADMTSWLSAQKELIRAQRELDEVNGNVAYWDSIINDPGFRDLAEEKQLQVRASLRAARNKQTSSQARVTQVTQIVKDREAKAKASQAGAPQPTSFGLSGPIGYGQQNQKGFLNRAGASLGFRPVNPLPQGEKGFHYELKDGVMVKVPTKKK